MKKCLGGFLMARRHIGKNPFCAIRFLLMSPCSRPLHDAQTIHNPAVPCATHAKTDNGHSELPDGRYAVHPHCRISVALV